MRKQKLKYKQKKGPKSVYFQMRIEQENEIKQRADSFGAKKKPTKMSACLLFEHNNSHKNHKHLNWIYLISLSLTDDPDLEIPLQIHNYCRLFTFVGWFFSFFLFFFWYSFTFDLLFLIYCHCIQNTKFRKFKTIHFIINLFFVCLLFIAICIYLFSFLFQ